MNKLKYLLLLIGSASITCAFAKTTCVTTAGYATCKVDKTTTESYICCSGQDWRGPQVRWLKSPNKNETSCSFYGSNIDTDSSCQSSTMVHNDTEGTMQRSLDEICKSKSGKLKLTD